LDSPQSPFVVSVDHIGITVRDLDAARHFYGDVLGLKVLVEATEDDSARDEQQVSSAPEDGAPEGGLYDSHHVVRRSLAFEPINGVAITLNSYPEDNLKGAPAGRLDRLGYTHLAFDVPDLAAFTDKMRALGIAPVAPGYYPDPDGNLVQVDEAGHNQRIRERIRDERRAQ
jgi:catechol 2,3-dioxygenase-like lactoylglutathione lyase family enzyme